MNQDIVNELERLREQYDEFGDVAREKAYSRAIESISKHPKRIMSGKDATSLKWIGDGIGWRIDQFLGTDTVGETGATTNDAAPKKKRAPKKKHAILEGDDDDGGGGEVIPKMKANFVDTRSKRANFVADSPPPPERQQPRPDRQQPRPDRQQPRPDRQQTIVNRSEELPREMATQLLGVIKKIAPTPHISLVDAYRRGYQYIPLLMFLLTDTTQLNSTHSIRHSLSVISDQLIRSGILVSPRWGNNSLQGYARFRTGHQVPIYFICVSAMNWPVALLRYTGPQLIWEQMQDAAVSRGYQLTETGLYQRQNTQPVLVRNEKELFKLVNVEYLLPEERG
jgi:DNA polymerase/3'-5' exonuclease PolX